jgi:hypothetical protein
VTTATDTPTQARERPILFSAPMVRALLDGRKTQTRRVVKWEPSASGLPRTHLHDFSRATADHGFPDDEGRYLYHYLHVPFAHPGDGWEKDPSGDARTRVYCPIGAAGDRLWVREPLRRSETAYGEKIQYVADDTYCLSGGVLSDNRVEAAPWSWKVSSLAGRYMPRWASRITLEVNEVRVQRVQDISEADAKAEGVEKQFRTVAMRPDGGPDYHIPNSYRGGFANLWSQINGKTYPWDSNPWVWVLTFARIP